MTPQIQKIISFSKQVECNSQFYNAIDIIHGHLVAIMMH